MSSEGGGVIGFIRTLVVRVYSFGLICLILYACWVGIRYLVDTVFYPASVPAWFTSWEANLDADSLRHENVGGMSAEALRAPIGHYHGVDRWYQPDRFDGCTTSGCHHPLPHSKSKATRAFANLHSTFLACEMCHQRDLATPAPAMWVSLRNGTPSDQPPVLRLIQYFSKNSAQVDADPRAAHQAILPLLNEMRKQLGEDELLDYFHVQLTTSQPGSPVWRDAVHSLRRDLQNHTRGEYSAKLMPQRSAADLQAYRSGMREGATAYLLAAEGSAAREKMRDDLHENILTTPNGCVACHGSDDSLRLDFEAMGFTAQRAAELRGSLIASVVERMRRGEPFHLPNVLAGPNGSAKDESGE